MIWLKSIGRSDNMSFSCNSKAMLPKQGEHQTESPRFPGLILLEATIEMSPQAFNANIANFV